MYAFKFLHHTHVCDENILKSVKIPTLFKIKLYSILRQFSIKMLTPSAFYGI